MECCQFKQLHPKWDGRLVSMKMDEERRTEGGKKVRKREQRQRGGKKERNMKERSGGSGKEETMTAESRSMAN